MLLASPVLVAVLGMGALDRTAQTTFFIPSRGGSQYLYENLFWVFGHPEVYILALPGFGIILELLPVFARKPLWGYRLAVSGMLGVTLLSWLVWQHHLFMSGINSDSRPFYMFSTELISIPTGFTFLCGLMTLWRGRIRLAVPMLFCLAWFFNFLIGGLSGSSSRTCRATRRCTGASSRWRTSTTRSWAGSCSRSSPRSTSGCRR